MVLGQSAAVAAVQAIDAKTSVQKVDIKKLQSVLKSNPLADGSTPEIVIDNDQKSMVELSGNWTTKKNVGFGPSTLIAEKGTADAFVKFKPVITKDGDYDVYAYFLPKYQDLSSSINVVVSDGTNETEVPVKLSELVALGQTSGEWIHLGKFKLSKAKKPFVKIATKGADGVVLADAVLIKPTF